jgi:hypothetical protein
VLVRNFELPPNTAVIWWVPVVSDDVVRAAWPELFRVTLPRVVLPFLKVTEPAGTAVPGAFATTVAVKVTA